MAEAAIGVAAAGAIGKTIFGFEAADAQNAALDTQAQENILAAEDQTIQRQESLKKMLGAQVAQTAASGIEVSSASLQAIQVDTFNKFAEDQELANLELDITNENIAQQQRNNSEQAWISGFSNLFGAATSIFGGPSVTAPTKGFSVFGESSSLSTAFRQKSTAQIAGGK
jgi:hypothetical protein